MAYGHSMPVHVTSGPKGHWSHVPLIVQSILVGLYEDWPFGPVRAIGLYEDWPFGPVRAIGLYKVRPVEDWPYRHKRTNPSGWSLMPLKLLMK